MKLSARISMAVGLLILTMGLLWVPAMAGYQGTTPPPNDDDYYLVVVSMWFEGSNVSTKNSARISVDVDGTSQTIVESSAWAGDSNNKLAGRYYTNDVVGDVITFYKEDNGINNRWMYYDVKVYAPKLDTNLYSSGRLEHKFPLTGDKDFTGTVTIPVDNMGTVNVPMAGGEIYTVTGRTNGNVFLPTIPAGEFKIPTKTGYTCDGYKYNDTQVYQVKDGMLVSNQFETFPHGCTLEIKWVPKYYKVTLDRQGATNGAASTRIAYNDSTYSVSKPSRTGYVFQGYYTGKNGTGTQYINGSGRGIKTWDMAKDTTLYAHWTKNPVPNIVGTDTTKTYSTIDYYLYHMFTIPSGVGDISYAILGGTGEGTIEHLSGNAYYVEVTKAGTFEIQVKTGKSSKYWDGVATATLTYNKAKAVADGNLVTFYTGEYDGQAHTVATITGENANRKYKAASVTETITNVGTMDYGVTFTSPLYEDYTREGTVEVTAKSVEGATVGTFQAMTYDGTAQSPKATVTIDGLPATGTWSQVTNVADTTTFTADGNFTGTIAGISPGMAKADYDLSRVVFEDARLEYDGNAHTITATQVPTGITVTYTGAQTDVGSATVTARFAGETANHNLIPNKTATITVTPRVVADHSGEFVLEDLADSYVYTGSPIAPAPAVSWQGQDLTPGVDFTYDYKNNVATGTATVTVGYQGNFKGETPLEYVIAYAGLPAGTTNDGYFTMPEDHNGWYNSNLALTPVGGTIGTTETGTGGVVIPSGDTGNGSLTVFVKDQMGNIYKTFAPYKMDQTAPTITELTGNATQWQNTDVTLTVTGATDGLSGLDDLAYSFDGGATWQSGNSKIYGANTENIVVQVKDKAGNVYTHSPVTISKIDKTAPVVTVGSFDLAKWYGSDSLVLQGATDTKLDTVTIYRAGWDQAKVLEPDGQGAYQYNAQEIQAGTYTYTIIATDLAGNQTTKQVTFHLDPVINLAVEILGDIGTVDKAMGANQWYDTLTPIQKHHVNLCDDTKDKVIQLEESVAGLTEDMVATVVEAIAKANTVEAIQQAKAALDALPDGVVVPEEVVKTLEDLVANATYVKAVETILDRAQSPDATYEEKMAGIGAVESYEKAHETDSLLPPAYQNSREDLERETKDITALVEAMEQVKAPYDGKDREAMEDIQAQYDKLPQKEKDLLNSSNHKASYDDLTDVLERVHQVEIAMDNVTPGNSKEVKVTYDSLPDDLKAMVDRAAVSKVDKAYKDLVANQNREEKAVTDFVVAVQVAKADPTVSKITALEKTYEAFTEAQKSAVSNKGDYDNLVAGLGTLQPVLGLLGQLDPEKLTSDSVTAVKDALAAYDNLKATGTLSKETLQTMLVGATGNKVEILKQAVSTWESVHQAVEAVKQLPKEEDNVTIDFTKPGSKSTVEQAKIAYEKLTDAGRLLVTQEDKITLNTAYDGLMSYLEYNNRAKTQKTTVEVAGLAEKVEIPQDASVDVVTISVIAKDGEPAVMPAPTQKSKEVLLSVDVKLLAEYFVETSSGEDTVRTSLGQDHVQPKAPILLKWHCPRASIWTTWSCGM